MRESENMRNKRVNAHRKSLALIVAIVMTVLAGCGGNSSAGMSAGEEREAQAGNESAVSQVSADEDTVSENVGNDSVSTDSASNNESEGDGGSDSNGRVVIPEEPKKGKLSDDDLKAVKEYIDAEYNGFLTCSYSRPEEIVWGEVLYNGGGISTELTDEELKAFKNTTGGEIYTDITAIRGETLSNYVKQTSGTLYEDAICPIGWTYLEDYDVYCFMHGDTNRVFFEFDDGSYENGVYTLHYEYFDDFYEPCEYETKARRLKDGRLQFISNIPSTWEGNKDISGIYGGVLRKYARCLDYEKSYEYMENIGVNTHCSLAYTYAETDGASPRDYVGYELRDINADGYNELFIGPMDAIGDSYVYQIYTIKDGLPKLLADCSYRGELHLLPDNRIYESNAATMYYFSMHRYYLDQVTNELVEDAAYYMEDTSYYDDNGRILYYKKVIDDSVSSNGNDSVSDNKNKSESSDEKRDTESDADTSVGDNGNKSAGSDADKSVSDNGNKETGSDADTNVSDNGGNSAESDDAEDPEVWIEIDKDEYENADIIPDGTVKLEWTSFSELISNVESSEDEEVSGNYVMSHLTYNDTLGEANEELSRYDESEKTYVDAYVFDGMVDLRLGRLKEAKDIDEAIETVAGEMEIGADSVSACRMDQEIMDGEEFGTPSEFYRLSYSTGGNEDKRDCNDLVFLEKDGLLWFHTGIPSDHFGEYGDQIGRWEEGLKVMAYDGRDKRGSNIGKSIFIKDAYLTGAELNEGSKLMMLKLNDVVNVTPRTPELVEYYGVEPGSGDTGYVTQIDEDETSKMYIADKGEVLLYVTVVNNNGGYLDTIRVAGEDFVKSMKKKGIGKGKSVMVRYKYDPVSRRVTEIRESD